MNTIEAIRKRRRLSADQPVGVRGVFGKSLKIQGDGRTVDVIANTDDVDLTDEVVVPSGADTTYFRKNGNIFADHETELDSYVGKLRKADPFPSNADWSAWRVQVYVRQTELGDDILKMVQEGGVGVSIGFIPVDWGRPTDQEIAMYGSGVQSVVRKWKWLELSFTAFPCNVACQVIGGPPAPDASKAAVIESLLTKGLIRKESAALVGFPVAKPKRIIRVTAA